MRIPSVITLLPLIVCVNLAAAVATNAPASPPTKSGLLWFIGHDLTNTPASPPAVQELLTIRRFALGGVGFAGTMSEGEVAYRTIVTNTNAVQLFKTVLTNGTTEAKLYALCGIRQLAPKEFDACAKPIIAANEKVSMQAGCEAYESRAYIVASRIKDGTYDRDLTSQPRNPYLYPVPVAPQRGPGGQ